MDEGLVYKAIAGGFFKAIFVALISLVSWSEFVLSKLPGIYSIEYAFIIR